VKVSYFPNWQAFGAEGPWRVTPNLMLVVPTSHDVTLHYGTSPANFVGLVLTGLGLVALVVVGRRPALAIGRAARSRRALANGGSDGSGGARPANRSRRRNRKAFPRDDASAPDAEGAVGSHFFTQR